jgi:hypothetical protein
MSKLRYDVVKIGKCIRYLLIDGNFQFTSAALTVSCSIVSALSACGGIDSAVQSSEMKGNANSKCE